jgi:hypothetical protein
MQRVRYLTDVSEPERLAGEVGQVRELEDWYAQHLLQERCVVLDVAAPPAAAAEPALESGNSQSETEPEKTPAAKRRK